MAEKDITEKLLFDHNDVFADIINVLLFHGERIVDPDSLESTGLHSQYKADSDGKLHEQERDISKRWKNASFQLAFLGIENQTSIDDQMPLRIIGYDGAAYRSQYGQDNPLYPVVTLVLYFGSGHWDKARSLYDILTIPEALKPYVSDYKINIFEICNLDPAVVKQFQSDFRIIADFFVNSKNNPDYVPDEATIKYIDEFLKLMNVLTGDQRYSEVAKHYQEQKIGGGIRMCEVLDRVENKGRQEGLQEGRQEGRQEGLQEAISKLMENLDISFEKALEVLKIPAEERKLYHP